MKDLDDVQQFDEFDNRIHWHHSDQFPMFRTEPGGTFATARCLECMREVGIDVVLNTYFWRIEKLLRSS